MKISELSDDRLKAIIYDAQKNIQIAEMELVRRTQARGQTDPNIIIPKTGAEKKEKK